MIRWNDVQRVQRRGQPGRVVIAPGAISWQGLAGGVAPSAPSWLPTTRAIPSHRVKIGGGELGTRQTLEAMSKLALEASRDPQWIDHARSVVSGLPNKAYRQEAQAIFDHVKRTVRYVHDPIGMETITDPRWLMFVTGAGDCDDHSALVAALGLSVGLGAAFRTVAVDCGDKDPKTCPWVHVYPLLGIPRGNVVEWVAADTTQPGGYLGWEPQDRIKRVATWLIASPAE